MTPREILKIEPTLGVLYDIVANRYIAPDEEIYRDHGATWQQAWEAHMESWRPLVADLEDENGNGNADALEPLIGMEACGQGGLDYGNNIIIEDNTIMSVPECIANHTRTNALMSNPPSVNDMTATDTDFAVTTGCFYLPDWDALSDVTDVTPGSTYTIADQQKIVPWRYATEQGTTGGLFPCQLLVQAKSYNGDDDDDAEQEQLYYTVLVLLDHDEHGWDYQADDEETSTSPSPQIQLVRNVPQRAIQRITQEWRQQAVVDHISMLSLFGRIKTSPPFRHYMQVSEDAFPLTWRNLANKATATAPLPPSVDANTSSSYELTNATSSDTGVPSSHGIMHIHKIPFETNC
jgi:hypothetical protein